MEIEIAMLVEIRMNRHCHVMADAEDGTKGIGTRTQVSYRAEVFHGETFLLKRVLLRISCAIYLDAICLNLRRLPLTHRLYERTFAANTTAGGDGLELLF